jgi:hypothetical protein
MKKKLISTQKPTEKPWLHLVKLLTCSQRVRRLRKPKNRRRTKKVVMEMKVKRVMMKR